MKDIAWKLLSELMKDSKKSDRELAAKLGVSQATVSRTRKELEKDGYIREYTAIPDFYKLGFEIMALTLVKLKKDLSEAEVGKIRKFSDEFLKKNPFAVIMAVEGSGLGFDNVVVSLHENFDAFVRYANATRQVPFAELADFQSFLVSLSARHYQPLTLSTLADYLLTMKGKIHR
jgi:DNA-binding Lrp family transcriptional regulator